jgi:hypothetical protein
MATQRKHFITFYSPGTFFSESTCKSIPEWDVPLAVKMAGEIVERYDAKPFGFKFSTSIISDPVPDEEGGLLQVEPKMIASSGMYHINGRLRTYDDVVNDNSEKDRILRLNMRCEDSCIVVETRNSYLSTHSFFEEDFVVDSDGNIVECGNDPKWVEYRKRKSEEFAKEYQMSQP